MIQFSKDDLNRLIRGELEPSEFSINRIKLNNSYQDIHFSEIIDIGLFDKATGKYFDNGSDYTFNQRLKMLRTNNAFVHLAGGLTCVITDEIITQIKIAKKYIGQLQMLTKDEIETFNGKPERELIDDTMWGIDYSLDGFISVYKNSTLYFYFQPETLTLQEVRIGHVNEEYYASK